MEVVGGGKTTERGSGHDDPPPLCFVRGREYFALPFRIRVGSLFLMCIVLLYNLYYSNVVNSSESVFICRIMLAFTSNGC